MDCLGADQIYLYLEGELNKGETAVINEHLAVCPECRRAMEDRKLLLEAASSLSTWEVPAGFSEQVMGRLFPYRPALGQALLTATIGSFLIISGLLATFIFSGQSLFNFLVSFNQTILNGLSSLTVMGARLVKLATLLVKVLYRFSGFLWESFSRLTTILSPEVQAGLIILTLIVSASLFYGIRHKVLVGGKR
jgi:hypothetical protein